MDEEKINQQLQNIENYQGSFAVDELNEIKLAYYPTMVIINLDKRSMGGSHWISVAVYKTKVFICDSLGGVKPNNPFPPELSFFLNNLLRKRRLLITKRLQPINSQLCGLYCITFVKELSKNNCFYDFLNLFSCNLQQNDDIIKFLNKGIKI